MKRVGTIYKIENTINNFVYIGQTIQSNPMIRWKDHYNAFLYGSNYPLYKDMRTLGVENFTFQIIETNIPENKLDEKEQFYIKKYNSTKNGYNILLGGQTEKFSKLCIEDVYNIIDLLKANKPIIEIAKIYKVSPSAISDINCGESWRFIDIEYPIIKSFNTKINFSQKDIFDIYKLLKEGISCKDIANIYGISNVTISNINNGKIYRQQNYEYPIYKAMNSKSHLSDIQVLNVINELLTTENTYLEIGKKLHIGRKTISNINNGCAYQKEIFNAGYTKFPIRDNYKV